MPTLYVNVINATDLKETQLVGRQDPFVEIRSDCQKRYTQYHNNGGRNPSWNEKKEIECRDFTGCLNFTIMNKNVLKDSVIGECVFNLSQLVSSGGYCEVNLPVMTKKSQAGVLHVIIQDSNYQLPPQPMPQPMPYPGQPMPQPMPYPPQPYPGQPMPQPMPYPPQPYPGQPMPQPMPYPPQPYPGQPMPQPYPPQQDYPGQPGIFPPVY